MGGGLMGPLDEIYHPGAQRARLDIQTYEERVAPMPSPDDLWSRIHRRARHPEPGVETTASDRSQYVWRSPSGSMMRRRISWP
jgi:hypothetical protein